MYFEQPRPTQVYRDAALLSHCSEDVACEWLKNRKVEYSSVMGTPRTPDDSHVLEYVLFRRKSKTIDTALANYGRSQTVLIRVYDRSDTSTRVAACANASLFVGDTHGKLFVSDNRNLLWDIVYSGSLAELRAVSENAFLTSGFYAALFKHWEGHPDSDVDKDNRLSSVRFKHIVRGLSNNLRVATPRSESKEGSYMDGFSDVEYHYLFSECWALAETAPVEEEWATILSQLYRHVVPYKHPGVLDDIYAVMRRWPSPADDKYSSMDVLRTEIAKKFMKPSLEMLNSEDAAIRRAFYETFDPEDTSFRELDWKQWAERDKYCNTELNWNKNVWRSQRGRESLKALLWHQSKDNFDMVSIGWFEESERQYRTSNPEWFLEERARLSTPEQLLGDRIGTLEQSINGMRQLVGDTKQANPILLFIVALVGALIGAAL